EHPQEQKGKIPRIIHNAVVIEVVCLSCSGCLSFSPHRFVALHPTPSRPVNRWPPPVHPRSYPSAPSGVFRQSSPLWVACRGGNAGTVRVRRGAYTPDRRIPPLFPSPRLSSCS